MINLGLVQPPGIKKIPITFSIPPATLASLGVETISSTYIIGFMGELTAIISGQDGVVSKNDTAIWNSSVLLHPGDVLNVKMSASNSFNTQVQSTVTIAGLSANYSITTCTNPNLSFANVTNALISTVYSTTGFNDSNVSQIMTINNGEISPDNTNWYNDDATIPSKSTFYIRQTSSGSPGTDTTMTVTCQGINTTWKVTTTAGVPPDLVYTNIGNSYINVEKYQFPTNQSNATLNFSISCPGATYAYVGNIALGGAGAVWGSSTNVAAGQPVYTRIRTNSTYSAVLSANISSNNGFNYNWNITSLNQIQNMTSYFSLNAPYVSSPIGNYIYSTSPITETFTISPGYQVNTITGSPEGGQVSNDSINWANSCIVPSGAILYFSCFANQTNPETPLRYGITIANGSFTITVDVTAV